MFRLNKVNDAFYEVFLIKKNKWMEENILLIWKGYGFVVPVIVFLVSLVLQYSLDEVFYQGYYTSAQWPYIAALVIAAIAVWFLGKKINKNTERILLDPDTGEEVRIVNCHSLFWIRVEYWAPILLVFAVMSFFR